MLRGYHEGVMKVRERRRGERVHTTKIIPRSFTKVHFRVCWSALYGGLLEADWPPFAPTVAVFSSMKTSEMKLFIIDGLMGAYDRDQRTTPDVVRISKVSSMVWWFWCKLWPEI